MHPPDSLYEGCSWFYALCREYLFRDHTQEIARALFSTGSPVPGTHVLELGCGPGFYACRLSEEYPQIHTTGVDLSRRLIARAKSRAASRSLQNCTFAHGDAHALPDATNSIDAVVVSRLFLIIRNRKAVVTEIFRVLRPGGRCFIAEPTSGFRTRIPFSCMWLLSKLTGTPAGKYPEPRQADVMTAPDFAALIRSQPWGTIDLQYDGWYQYAVCEKAPAVLAAPAHELRPADWSTSSSCPLPPCRIPPSMPRTRSPRESSPATRPNTLATSSTNSDSKKTTADNQMTTATNPATTSRASRAISSHAGQHWSIARPWQTNAALLLIGTALFFLTRQLISEYSQFTIGFSGVSGWSCILYLAAAFLILTQPVDRFTFPIILIVAVACRLVALFAEPYLSTDIYRYVWDGVVQHAHISPYRYAPGDPVLAFLRAPHQDIFDNINRRDYAHTIYPPAAQALFYLITWISPTITFMKTVMVLFEGVTMYALIKVLQYLGVRRERTLLYAWCPVLIWEIAGSGHLDSVAMAFIALALLARYRKQPILTGLFLAIAILLKFYPLVLLPALYRRGDFKMPATVAAIIAFGYGAYSSAGTLVFGFLGGYIKEEGLAAGTRYFLLELAQRVPGLHNLTTTAYYVFCAAVFAVILWWCWQIASQQGSDKLNHLRAGGDASFLTPAFALAAALMFLFSPHYAWYIIWLVPFFTLMPNLPVLTYLLGFFYLYTTALAVPGAKMFLANEILYAAVAAAFVIQLILSRWPIHRSLFVQPSTGSELL